MLQQAFFSIEILLAAAVVAILYFPSAFRPNNSYWEDRLNNRRAFAAAYALGAVIVLNILYQVWS